MGCRHTGSPPNQPLVAAALRAVCTCVCGVKRKRAYALRQNTERDRHRSKQASTTGATHRQELRTTSEWHVSYSGALNMARVHVFDILRYSRSVTVRRAARGARRSTHDGARSSLRDKSRMQRAPQAEPGPMIREYPAVPMGEKIASATTPPGPAPLHLGPALAPWPLRARVFPTKRPSDVHAPVPGSQTIADVSPGPSHSTI